MNRKRWIRIKEDIATASILQKVSGLNDIVARIMANRGIDSEESAKLFLNPSSKSLAHPSEIPQLKEAAQFILDLIKKGKKICVYGDYDADGITGTTLLVETFKELGAIDVSFYLPKRMTEGYGLNRDALAELKQQGYDLIVTVDCGVSDKNIIDYGNKIGLKFIVTDHHNPPAELPDALFIVNPKLIDKYVPFKNLAGVGVAYKLALQLFELNGDSPEKAISSLDLVALGTVADIVPLLDENRILVIEGLKQLNKENKRIGLSALQDVSSLKSKIMVRDISFGVAPRLNATGRLKNADVACELLLEKNRNKAYSIAKQIDKINKERQRIGLQIKEDILSKISKEKVMDQKMIILASDKWHPGIIGIVSAQLCRMYNRPAVLIAIMEKTGRGSIRSLPGIDIFESLSECSDLLMEFGGHKEAAGFEIEIDKIDEFIEKYNQAFAKKVSFDDLVPAIEVDMELKASEITKELAYELEKLEPYGQTNQKPIFFSDELSVIDYRKVGKDNNHLKLKIVHGTEVYEGIAYGMAEYADEIISFKNQEIAFNLDVNRWNGREELQLNIIDIRQKLAK